MSNATPAPINLSAADAAAAQIEHLQEQLAASKFESARYEQEARVLQEQLRNEQARAANVAATSVPALPTPVLPGVPTLFSSPPANVAALVPTTTIPGLRFAKISEFHGTAKENVENWIFELEQFFAAVESTTGVSSAQLIQQAVKYAASYLKGAALSWWRGVVEARVRENNVTPLDWPTFKQMLITQFRPIADDKIARLQLNQLQQRPGQVGEYVRRFRELLLKIKDMSEADKIDKFMRGLIPSIAREVDGLDAQHVEEYMLKAQKTELRFQQRGATLHPNIRNPFNRGPSRMYPNNGMRDQIPFQTVRQQSSTYTGPAPMELGSMETSQSFTGEEGQEWWDGFSSQLESDPDSGLNALTNRGRFFHRPTPNSMKKLTPEEREACRREGRCFRCRQKGHMLKECPKSLITQPKNSKAQQ